MKIWNKFIIALNTAILKKNSKNLSQIETHKKGDERKQGIDEESEIDREGEESEDEKAHSEFSSPKIVSHETDELGFEESTISNIQLSGQKDNILKIKSAKIHTKTPRANQKTKTAEPSSLLYVEGGSDYHKMFFNPPKCLKVKSKKKKKARRGRIN
jgi:hypothetical protein